MTMVSPRMRRDDKELVPRFLIRAMVALMVCSVALVSFAVLTDRPLEAVLVEAPIVAERSVLLTGNRSGTYTVTDVATGDVIAMSSEDKAGFIGVIGKSISFERGRQGLAEDAPVRVVRRENGHIAILDDTTGMVVELIGYGADNVAAFARIVN
jgi:putative photosynthetic complex assembly protein